MRPLRALLLAAVTAGLTACDTIADQVDEVSFGGVTYTAIGGAELRLEDDGLGVVGPGGSADYGVRVAPDAGIQRAEFYVEPVDLPAESRWGLELFGDAGGTRASFATAWNDAIDANRHALLFDFKPATGASAVTFEYYLDGALQLRVPDVPLTGSGERRIINGGTSNGEPGSVHVIRDGSRIIVATDYNGAPPPGFAQGGCSGALISLDFPDVPDVPAEVCADYVQAVPDAFTGADAVEDVEIRAMVVSRFTIVDGTVD